jgi:hypothetical protein
MIEASTASARSCGVIRSISAAVIILKDFASASLRRDSSEAAEGGFDGVEGAVGVDDPG